MFHTLCLRQQYATYKVSFEVHCGFRALAHMLVPKFLDSAQKEGMCFPILNGYLQPLSMRAHERQAATQGLPRFQRIMHIRNQICLKSRMSSVSYFPEEFKNMLGAAFCQEPRKSTDFYVLVGFRHVFEAEMHFLIVSPEFCDVHSYVFSWLSVYYDALDEFCYFRHFRFF